MDYIQFYCPSCHYLLAVPPEAAGLSGACPSCHNLILGPGQATLVPEPLHSEPLHSESLHPESLHPESLHPESLHPESLHPESLHPESLHPESLHPESLHPESLHPESLHPESLHPESLHPESLHPESLHPESLHPESLHPEPRQQAAVQTPSQNPLASASRLAPEPAPTHPFAEPEQPVASFSHIPEPRPEAAPPFSRTPDPAPQPSSPQPDSPEAAAKPAAKTSRVTAATPQPTRTDDFFSSPEKKEAPVNPDQHPWYKRLPSLSLRQAAIVCFFFSLFFFILGFSIAKLTSRNKEGSVGNPSQQRHLSASGDDQQTSAATSANDDTLIPITPLEASASPSQGGSEKITTHRATLEAFLEASSWGARNAYVLNSKAVLAMMSKDAEVNGDGPIAYESMDLQSDGPEMKVYWLKLAALAHPFSVVMLKEKDWWLIDWLGFSDFHRDRLGSFLAGKKGPDTGVFRVLLKAAPGEDSPLSPSQCLLSTPQSTEPYPISSIKDSPARRKLAQIFQAYTQGEPEKFNAAMAGDGIPLTLEISRNSAKTPVLKLEKIIATGWSPLDPLQGEKDSSARFY